MWNIVDTLTRCTPVWCLTSAESTLSTTSPVPSFSTTTPSTSDNRTSHLVRLRRHSLGGIINWYFWLNFSRIQRWDFFKLPFWNFQKSFHFIFFIFLNANHCLNYEAKYFRNFIFRFQLYSKSKR
jgi:hypothetical protein